MNRCVVGGLALVLAAAAAPAAADGSATTVNCNRGQKITNALNAGFNETSVRGTCREDVEIRRDDVTIVGLSGAKVVGQIFANGARRIAIQNLVIEGTKPTPSGYGVFLDRGATAVLDHVTVRGAISGVFATGHSFIEVRNGSVSESNEEIGIFIDLGSAGRVSESTVRNHANDSGIQAHRGSSVEVDGNAIENNLIGVFAGENSDVRLTGNTITGEGEALLLRRGGTARLRGGGNLLASPPDVHAINLAGGTQLTQDRGHDTVIGLVGIFEADVARFEDVEIQGSVGLQNRSTLTLSARAPGAGIVVTGGISLGEGSTLLLGGDEPIQINDGVGCNDNESSVTTPLPGNVSVPGGVACTGFD